MDEMLKPEETISVTPETANEPLPAEEAAAPAADAALQAAQAELAELRAKLEEAEQRCTEYLKARQQAEASFASFRRRVEAERNEWTWQANARLLASLLPVLDDFERAYQTMPAALQALSWTGGLWLIRRKLEWLLETEGVKPISVNRGQAFDPYLHEAVMQVETSEVAEGCIVQEVQRGYIWNERVVLRPALVSVARAAAAAATPGEAAPSTEVSEAAAAEPEAQAGTEVETVEDPHTETQEDKG